MCVLDIEHKPVAPWLIQLIDELRAHTHTPTHIYTHTHTKRHTYAGAYAAEAESGKWKMEEKNINNGSKGSACLCMSMSRLCLPLMIVESKIVCKRISIECIHRTLDGKMFQLFNDNNRRQQIMNNRVH